MFQRLWGDLPVLVPPEYKDAQNIYYCQYLNMYGAKVPSKCLTGRMSFASLIVDNSWSRMLGSRSVIAGDMLTTAVSI